MAVRALHLPAEQHRRPAGLVLGGEPGDVEVQGHLICRVTAPDVRAHEALPRPEPIPVVINALNAEGIESAYGALFKFLTIRIVLGVIRVRVLHIHRPTRSLVFTDEIEERDRPQDGGTIVFACLIPDPVGLLTTQGAETPVMIQSPECVDVSLFKASWTASMTDLLCLRHPIAQRRHINQRIKTLADTGVWDGVNACLSVLRNAL